MDLLFYDLEFASCKGGHKICEFGYVIADEFLTVVKSGNIIINPDIARSDWDDYVLEHILKRDIEEYEAAIKFDECYEEIANLFKTADYVIGHSTVNDALALNDECKRYNLPSIDHCFYDIKDFYKYLNNTTKNVSLENMLIEQGLDDSIYHSHEASNDAFDTMVVLRLWLQANNISFDSLIKQCTNAKDESKNYLVASLERYKALRIERELKEINLLKKGSANHEALVKFLSEIKPKENGSNLLKNKKVCISYNYEFNHFKELVNLIKFINDEGGTYTNKASECDLFVKFEILQEDGSKKPDSRMVCAERFNEDKNDKVEFIDFMDFLKMLSITNEHLEGLPLPEEVKVIHDGKRYRGKRKGNRKKFEFNSYPQLSLKLDILIN